jgi:hypothetical protein
VEFLIRTAKMSDAEAREFLSRRYNLLFVKSSVPKAVVEWLATSGPGELHDGPRGWTAEEIASAIRRASMVFVGNPEKFQGSVDYLLSVSESSNLCGACGFDSRR